MKNTFKKISAIAVMATLIASSGLFGVKAQAATAPSDVRVTLSDSSVDAGGASPVTISVTTTYSGNTATSVSYQFYNAYSAYDLNLYSYGYTGSASPYYYESIGGGIGSFSATASNPASGQTTTVTVPSSAYGSYTVKATVTNATGSATSTASFFVANSSMDTAKPSITDVSVGIKNNGNSQYLEITATATDAYSRAGQRASEVAMVQVAFENTTKTGTWTNTVTLTPVNSNNQVFYGRLDISTIKEPGTYVLNSAKVADTSGNVATYKKSGSTLQSSSADTQFFPRNLDKVTFKIGESAGEPVTTSKETQATQATQVSNDVSPKTSENGAVHVSVVLLAVMLLGGVSLVAVLAKKTK